MSGFSERAFAEILLLLCYFFGTNEIVLSGDKIRLGSMGPESVIVIGNHQSYVDWIYLWILAYYFKAHGMVKIILRADLSYIPIIGWVIFFPYFLFYIIFQGMRVFEFIFLKRRWKHDKKTFAKQLNRMNSDRNPVWLLIFPEGTLNTKNGKNKSNQYADRIGLAVCIHCID